MQRTIRPRRARPVMLALLAALLWSATPELPGSAHGQAVPAEESVAGRFLIAEPDMEDPNFEQTVIYMLDHTARGALGLVINKPLGTIALKRLLDAYDEDSARRDENDEAAGARTEVTVYGGGPVDPQRVFVLHSDDVLLPVSRRLDSGVAVTGSPEILRLLRENRGPGSVLVVFGYAGWAPQQLDRELESGSWDVVPYDSELLFETPNAQKWRKARAARRIDL